MRAGARTVMLTVLAALAAHTFITVTIGSEEDKPSYIWHLDPPHVWWWAAYPDEGKIDLVAVLPYEQTEAEAEVLPSYGEPWEASWPAWEWENVRRVDACESASGTHPDTYDTGAVHGGRMQIAKAVWADYFLREYGLDWATVVLDDEVNFWAARIIWEQSGWGAWPFCARGLW